MGLLQDILGVAAPIVGGIFGGPVGAAIGGGVGGLLSSKSASTPSGTQTVTNKAEMDPRVGGMLFGNGTKRLKPGVTPTWAPGQPDANGQTWDTASNPDSDYATDGGLLGQYRGMLGAPQSDAMKQYGTESGQFLGTNSAGMTMDMHKTANNLMGGNITAPGMQSYYSPQTGAATAASVNAPAQNGMNLSGSYDGFINGERGGNTRLTQATQGAIDQSTNQFRQMQGDATNNLMRNILPQVGSNAVLAGQYGGSRQGIAEGNAISDFTRQQGQAMTQFGQNNTNAAVGAQANAYETDSNRALSATQGLGAQQYGVASQNASMGQQTELMNKSQYQQHNQFNAGLQQDAAHQNLGAQLSTDQLNTGRQTAGIAANSGLIGTAYAAGQNQDSYALNQAGKVNGLLAPYLGQVPGSSTSSQPLYQNTAGNVLGGATAGLALGKQFGGLLGSTGSNSYYANNDLLTS